MAEKIASLYAEISADTSKLKSGLGQAKKSLEGSEKALDATAKKTSSLNASLNLLAVAGVAALGKFALDSVKKASDLNETLSKTKIVMGDAAGAVFKYAKEEAASFGLSEQAALDAASTFAIFGKSAGLVGEDLSGFSLDLTKLTSDIASFNNATPEEVIMALGAALRGEAEPMRRFGVLLDDATLRAKALEMGIISTTKNALTPQQRVLAANAVIFEQTADAQGDFARTSSGLANQTRILNAQMEDMSTTLGQKLLPPAIDFVTLANDLLALEVDTWFKDGADAAAKFNNSLFFGKKAIENVGDSVNVGIGELRKYESGLYGANTATDELKQSSEDAAKVLKNQLTQQLKDLQSFVDGELGPSIEDFNLQQGELQTEIDKVQGKITELNAKEYLTDDQKQELTDLKTELANLKGQYTENADEHEKATKRILFDMLLQRIELSGLSDTEKAVALSMANDMADKWGLIDKSTLAATQAIDFYLQKLATDKGNVAVQGMLDEQLLKLTNITAYLNSLNGKTFSYTLRANMEANNVGVVTMPSMQGPPASSNPGAPAPALWNEVPGGQHGLDMIVPGGYQNDSFPVWASSGEHIKITPADKIGANPSIVININGSVERNDIYTLARAVGAEIQKQARYN